MFGGSRGSGKSDYLLGDFLGGVPYYKGNWHGYLFRRTYDELIGLIERAKRLYIPTGARFTAKPANFVWPNGATLGLRYLDRDDDVMHYQGHEKCVAVGTLIIMAGEKAKAIEEIKKGDHVVTLSGRREVTAVTFPYKAPCVRVTTVYGSQVHPIWHQVLTPGGWKSYNSMQDKLVEVNDISSRGSMMEFSAVLLGKGERITYPHPYTGELTNSRNEAISEIATVEPCGDEWVCDITVADANHYISRNSRLINRNTWLGFDELTNWKTPYVYDAMKGVLRWSEAEVPTKRIRSSCNPGGPGHSWVKERFIDPCRTGYKLIKDKYGERVFIPARISDNKILLKSDPYYIDTLKLVGSESLVKAWLYGDWDISLGSYFSSWRSDLHVIEPCRIDPAWVRIGGFDWGSARPFCFLKVAVADGTTHIPRGALIVYHETYGGDRNAGWGWHADQVAKVLDGKDTIFNVADTSIWDEDGGQSIAERMSPYIKFRPADKKRKPGWDSVRARLAGEDGKPMLYVFKTCTNLIRTLPLLQHDKHDAEDLDTDGEDHCADALRYICMSRPYVRTAPAKKEPLRGVEKMSLDELWEIHEREQRNERWTS